MKLVMLDRDGVINYDSKDYIKSPSEWLPISGSFNALTLLHQAGFKIGVATNQSGIGRGYYSEETLAKIHKKMVLGLAEVGGQIDKIVYCPHLPDFGCDCRKPKPGMLYEIANFFGTSPRGHYFIGDRKSDVLAAKACGAIPLLITAHLCQSIKEELSEVLQFKNLFDAANYILNETA